MQVCIIVEDCTVHQVEIPTHAPRNVIDMALRRICRRLGILPEQIVDVCPPEYEYDKLEWCN